MTEKSKSAATLDVNGVQKGSPTNDSAVSVLVVVAFVCLVCFVFG